MPNYSLKNISVTNNFKRAESISFGIGVALIQPSISKSGCLRIKFKISQLIDWIGLGVCKKEIVEKNSYQFGNSTNIGHGVIIQSLGTLLHGIIQISKRIINKFQISNLQIMISLHQQQIQIGLLSHGVMKLKNNNIIKFKMEDNLFFCAVLRFKGDCVEIIG